VGIILARKQHLYYKITLKVASLDLHSEQERQLQGDFKPGWSG
jgi:hypothetical protein